MELMEESYDFNIENINILMGVFNARIEWDKEGLESIMEPYGEDVRNTEGRI